MISIEVTKNRNENSVSLIRRFSRKVKSSGIVRTVRGKRYSTRCLSDYNKKRSRLRNLKKKDEYERMRKLGKLPQ